MSHLSVAKFGGTSVANYSAMQACAKIVIADPNTRVVVLSASALFFLEKACSRGLT